MPWVDSASVAEIQYTLVVHFVKAGGGQPRQTIDLHSRLGEQAIRKLRPKSLHMFEVNHANRQLNFRYTTPSVAAPKVAREVCASLKQSQFMRLFVPETCLWWNRLGCYQFWTIVRVRLWCVVFDLVLLNTHRTSPLEPTIEPTLETLAVSCNTPQRRGWRILIYLLSCSC